MKSRFSLYQKEYDNYVTRSNKHEMYLQSFHKPTLSLFDVKQCYIKENEGILWN